MSFPHTTATFPPTVSHPEPLLALACPTCFGAIAVGTDLLGQAAECPLCGCGFRVPLTGTADMPPQPVVAASPASPKTEPPARQRQQRREATPNAPPPKPAGSPATENAFDEPSPQAPVKELQFQDPVRTVGSGDQVITLRRLTPEEKAVRRTRRNLIMMLTGVSILMAIVFSLGTKRPKRRE